MINYHPLISLIKFSASATFILIISLFTSMAWGQNTILTSAMEYKKSMVIIRAIKQNITLNPDAQIAKDSSGKQLLSVKKGIVVNYEKKGAGIIIRNDGLIITNLHTIHGSNKIGIVLHDGKTVGAKLLHYRSEFDLALLKIEPPYPLNPIPFADSNQASLGDSIIHIGSSFLLKQTISGGRITAIGHAQNNLEPGKREIEFFRININIYKGDSGGPLLNKNGELIGIMFAKKINKDRKAFAIPSNKIKKLYMEYLK